MLDRSFDANFNNVRLPRAAGHTQIRSRAPNQLQSLGTFVRCVSLNKIMF
jgi:hypothetical protein